MVQPLCARRWRDHGWTHLDHRNGNYYPKMLFLTPQFLLTQQQAVGSGTQVDLQLPD